MLYTLIPVTKASPATREHAPITAAYLPRSGDLCLVFSPYWLADSPMHIGASVVCGYNDEDNTLLVALPPEGQKGGTRKICKRQGFPNAGHIIIPARNLPEALTAAAFAKRKPMDWRMNAENTGVIIQF